MKKIICILLCVALLLSFVGCGGNSPKSAFSSGMSAIKKMDTDGIQKYFNNADELDMSDVDGEYKSLTKLFFKDISYEINEVGEVKDGKCQLDVTIKNIDIADILQGVIATVAKESFGSLFGGEAMSEEDMAKLFEETFMDEYKEHKDDIVSTDVTINMVQDGDDWKVNADGKFINAIIGDLSGLGSFLG